MTAQEALALSTRKINHVIVAAIEDAAKHHKTETCIDSLWDGEMGAVMTEDDKFWLEENGYRLLQSMNYALLFMMNMKMFCM